MVVYIVILPWTSMNSMRAFLMDNIASDKKIVGNFNINILKADVDSLIITANLFFPHQEP